MALLYCEITPIILFEKIYLHGAISFCAESLDKGIEKIYALSVGLVQHFHAVPHGLHLAFNVGRRVRPGCLFLSFADFAFRWFRLCLIPGNARWHSEIVQFIQSVEEIYLSLCHRIIPPYAFAKYFHHPYYTYFRELVNTFLRICKKDFKNVAWKSPESGGCTKNFVSGKIIYNE
jgi:hypothetical protein